MNIKNLVPCTVFICSDEAQSLQLKYKFFYSDYPDGIHLIFTSRHYAEKFIREVLNLSYYEACVSVAYSCDMKQKLGFQINILSVPVVNIGGD